MKKFNRLTEKQMSKTTGGVIFAAVLSAVLVTGVVGTGTAVTASDK